MTQGSHSHAAPGTPLVIRLHLELTGEYEAREENRASHAGAAARDFLPDLILLDVLMPGVGGDELANEFRSSPKFREVPIVFLTAAVTAEEVKRRGGIIGGERFLAKPVTVQGLIDCIREELEKARLHPVEHKPAEVTSPPLAY